MDQPNPRQLALNRKVSLWNVRSHVDDLAKELSQYVYPEAGRWSVSERNQYRRTRARTINNTAWRARRTMASGLMAGATSPARPWFRLKTPDTELNDYDEVKGWLHDVGKVMQDVFSRSNTYQMLRHHYNELPTFGTSASLMYEDYKTIVHHHMLTMGEYAIAANHKREIDTLVREVPYTIYELVTEFGYDNVSRPVREQYDRKNWDHIVSVVHLIEPRKMRDVNSPTAKNMPWKSIWFEASGNSDEILKESGFRKFPGLVPRWNAVGGDYWGAGPGEEALGDIKQLQFLELRKAKGIDYQSDPPVQIPTVLRGHETDLLPGGTTYYDQGAPHGGIRTAYEVKLDINAVREDIMLVEKRIDQTFFVDLFLMLANMDTGRELTAREIAERHEEKLLMLGPVLESLHKELLGPLVDDTFERMVRANILPAPPLALQGMDLQIEFVSMLAQAQKAVGLGAVDRLLGTVGNIAIQRPEVWDKVDVDKAVDIYSDLLGADPDLIVGNDKIAIVRQQRQQVQAAQMAAETGSVLAKGAKDLSQADTSTQNGLTDFLGQAA